MEIINIKNLNFGYDRVKILKDVNLKIYKNDFVSIKGNNGSGKSTLLKLIIGQLKNYDGEITIFGEDIKTFRNWNKIGYVPQIDRDNITNFPISVKEMILLNLYYDFNFFNLPSKKHYKAVDDIIKTFHLDSFKNKNFNELSGGQKQRVMIAKAMVHDPELLIFDEPTVGIDKESKENFFNLIEHLHKEHDITIILVTHESSLENKNYIRHLEIKDGEIEEYV